MITSTNYIRPRGPEVNTATVVSQKVRLFSYDSSVNADERDRYFIPRQIGAMTDFTVTENRGMEEVRGVGAGDRIMEIIPGVTTTSLTANRVALWLQNMFQAFGYKSGIDGVVRSLRHHRWPFDIRQEIISSEAVINFKEPESGEGTGVGKTQADVQNFTNEDSAAQDNGNFALLTFYEGCWMTSWSFTSSSNQAIVTENCNITVSDIVAGYTAEFDEEDYLLSNNKRAFRVNPQRTIE